MAPEAKRTTLPPAHNVVSFETEIGGAAETVTITESVAVHPIAFVATTTKVVVVVGVADGFAVNAPTSVALGVQL